MRAPLSQYHAAALRRLYAQRSARRLITTEKKNVNTHTPDNELADEVAGLEESLYEFHLRLRDMTARHLWHRASLEQRMTGLLIE